MPWLVLPINLLHGVSFALLWAAGVASAEQETRELYQRHPDYLFAKVAMAQFALHRGELDQVEAIFDQTFGSICVIRTGAHVLDRYVLAKLRVLVVVVIAWMFSRRRSGGGR